MHASDGYRYDDMIVEQRASVTSMVPCPIEYWDHQERMDHNALHLTPTNNINHMKRMADITIIVKGVVV
jgi:hypothetical protein